MLFEGAIYNWGANSKVQLYILNQLGRDGGSVQTSSPQSKTTIRAPLTKCLELQNGALCQYDIVCQSLKPETWNAEAELESQLLLVAMDAVATAKPLL